MKTRTLGKTDLTVSRLGFGGARIGYEDVTPDQADQLLNGLIDVGVTLIDTAACYDDSEEQIGKWIGSRRDEYVLASKCGHVTGGATGLPWSANTIAHSIDRSLQRLKTDRIDLIQLHSCSAEVLAGGEAVEAILKAKEAGKVRYIGYSGDGDDALYAIGMGVFSTLQTSYNVVDQHARRKVLPAAQAAGMGVIAKRPLANASFKTVASRYDYADVYWERSQSMVFPEDAPTHGVELALRFNLSHELIDSAIVGTTRIENVKKNIETIGKGNLPAEVIASLFEQFDRVGGSWEPRG